MGSSPTPATKTRSASKNHLIGVRGDQLGISLGDGQTEAGPVPDAHGQAGSFRELGITDHYDPASPDVFDLSVPLAQLKEIRFE